MSYDPTWTNGNTSDRLDAGVHSVCLVDAQEIDASINRRRLLTYQNEQDFSSHLYGGAFVRQSTVATASSPPFDNFRDSLAEKILSPPFGTFGGVPPSPISMVWLWPVAGADVDKIIVSGGGSIGEGQVGLFQKLNGTNHWTDQTLSEGNTSIRNVHWNELRQATEWIHRGRWELPVYFAVGIFSIVPDTPWVGGAIANNGVDELRTIGFAVIRTEDTPAKGLTEVTVRSSSKLELTADLDCTVQVYHCLRPIEFITNRPTWNKYDPGGGSWSSPGGTGSGDATLIGSVSLTANTPGTVSGAGLTSALQAMIDGAEQNFLARRSDTGALTPQLTGTLTVDFEIDTPPN